LIQGRSERRDHDDSPTTRDGAFDRRSVDANDGAAFDCGGLCGRAYGRTGAKNDACSGMREAADGFAHGLAGAIRRSSLQGLREQVFPNVLGNAHVRGEFGEERLERLKMCARGMKNAQHPQGRTACATVSRQHMLQDGIEPRRNAPQELVRSRSKRIAVGPGRLDAGDGRGNVCLLECDLF
jgi:hypothetical protein